MWNITKGESLLTNQYERTTVRVLDTLLKVGIHQPFMPNGSEELVNHM
jgi:hypothetical protein